ncbi:MAG: hypothetical protein HOO99_03980 [Hyphomicrobiaceae bacterium]|nr:hypothetical protein [Hyphomicrobiaceae bacterium]
MTTALEYYIIDLRPEWNARPYISLWGPNNGGYVYSVRDGYAGRYTQSNLLPGYHYKHRYGSLRSLDRFPVLCSIVENLAGPPRTEGRFRIESGGPVILNTGDNRTHLRRYRLNIGDPTAFDRRTKPAEAKPSEAAPSGRLAERVSDAPNKGVAA